MVQNSTKDDIKPGDVIQSSDTLFVVNCTNSTKKFSYKDEHIKLTAPGTSLSVQPVSHNMLNSPGFLAMWTDGRIRVSRSPKLQYVATSAAVEEAKQEKERMQSLHKTLKQVKEQQEDNSNVQDLSYKFHKTMDESMYTDNVSLVEGR